MATPASAYPRLSDDGLSLVAGDRVLVKDRTTEIGSGIGGQFGANGWIYFGGHDGVFRSWRDGVIEVVRQQGFNAFCVAGERWLGWRPDTGLVWHNEVVWAGWHSPALSETRWAAILDTPGGKWLFAGRGDGQDGEIVAFNARDPVLRGDLLTWVVDDASGSSVWGQQWHDGPIERLSLPGNTRQGYIVPVEIDGERWALSHDHLRAMLYPWGEHEGYVVAFAPAHRPDGRQRPDGPVRVVYDAEHDVLGEYLVDVRTVPRVDLRAQATPQPQRLPEGTEIDLLPFLVGDASTWPRDGDHYMHQVWDGRNLHFLKFGPMATSSTFCDNWERLVLDGDQFYLREDRSQSGAGIYSFHPGTAFKRRMRVGQWINVSNNVLQRYEKGTCEVIDQHPLPYRLGLVEAWTHFDCGGDLGLRDVVKCSYDPGGDRDSIEHFWYARGAGWFRWQEQRQDDPSRTHTTSFNRIGGVSLTPTQGCWRRDLVPWPPNQPKPPDPKPPDPPKPDPKPEPVMMTTFRTSDGQHYLCAEGGGGREIVADRTKPEAWETFEVVRVDATHIGLKAHNGQFVCAEDGGGRELVANREGLDAWETFEVVPVEGGIALRTSGGQFVCAENGGGGVVVANRSEAGAWETFSTSGALTDGVVSGGGPAMPVPDGGLDRIDGQLQIESGGGFVINGRPVLPTLCHYGDALSKWMRDRDHVRRNLDLISGAGYHGIRYWTVLDGDWWNGRHVGENFQHDYWDQHRAFLLELKARGLVAQISQGSLTRDAVPDRPAFANRMADLLSDVGTDVCALFEGVNEARDTGEPDAGRLASFVRVFKSRLPQVLCALSAYTGTEDVGILDDFSRDPADVFVVHPYRGGGNHDKTRHLMSLRYEGKPAKRLGWNGEGPGGGNRVSAIDNRDEMTGATMCGLAAMSFMMRMAYVYFCGVGVISDDGGSQAFDQMPGFFDVPKVRALVPADVMRYSGPIFHGGETWRNDRTFAARGEVRADHVVHSDGRQVIGIYGPGDLNVPQERGFNADVDHRFGNEFRLVVGRTS